VCVCVCVCVPIKAAHAKDREAWRSARVALESSRDGFARDLKFVTLRLESREQELQETRAAVAARVAALTEEIGVAQRQASDRSQHAHAESSEAGAATDCPIRRGESSPSTQLGSPRGEDRVCPGRVLCSPRAGVARGAGGGGRPREDWGGGAANEGRSGDAAGSGANRTAPARVDCRSSSGGSLGGGGRGSALGRVSPFDHST